MRRLVRAAAERRPGSDSPAVTLAAVRPFSEGRPLDPETRRAMEWHFGHRFDAVRVHTDTEAAQKADELRADAYTVGSDLVFGAGRYDPGTRSGCHLLAHELAHVVQGGGAAASGQLDPTTVSSPSDAVERSAETAAATVVAGGQTQGLGTAPAGTLLRAVKSNGGEFDTTAYAAVNSGAGVGKTVGADINLKFTPNDLVEADAIGLIQTVKTLRSTTAGGPVNDPSNARTVPDALSKGEGDVGRGVDQLDYVPGTTIPQTNPLYAVGNKAGTISTTLTDVPPDPANGWGDHGHHKRMADGTFDAAKDATLNDAPRRRLGFAGQEWQQSFEVAALALSGPMTNTYLGSIAWGWQCDATGTAALSPGAIRLERSGAPTEAFMDAAKKWNRMQVTDPSTGTKYDTVDIPTTASSSSAVAAKDMSSSALALRIAEIEADVAKLPPGPGVDRTNKEFEKKALEAELALRPDKPTTTLATETAKAKAMPTKDLITRLEAVAAEVFKAGVADALAMIRGTPPTTDSAKTDTHLELHALEAEMKTRSVKVEVKVASTEDWFGGDEVYVKVRGPRDTKHRSLTHDLKAGASKTFLVPLKDFMPLTTGLTVEVWDQDWPDADDLIVSMPWDRPWAEARNDKSMDGASYEVKVDFER